LRRRHVGFVFQFFNLLPTLSANENVALPLLLNGHNVAEARRRAAEVLELVGLEARGDAFPNQLSGGEQQRVAIARAVVHRPTLLIADEPTGSLDSANGVVVLDLLDRCHRELGVTVLLATHSPEVARRGTGILLMRDGRLSPG
jgi:putative ABC transport system ATP-binding protein